MNSIRGESSTFCICFGLGLLPISNLKSPPLKKTPFKKPETCNTPAFGYPEFWLSITLQFLEPKKSNIDEHLTVCVPLNADVRAPTRA